MPKGYKGVMREFAKGELHSGSSTGPVVTKPAQAKAIAASEDRQLHRHRMAGRHGREYITEHHRGAKNRGKA